MRSDKTFERGVKKLRDNQYLYHYTSIKTLALILKNKSIRFNNLMNVDDPEEAETEDIEKAGRFCLVSCWTAQTEDVLPMWNMYTPDMSGVRIKMRQYPFKKYMYRKGECDFSQETISYINYYSNYNKGITILADFPHLIEVEYTEDVSLIRPKIYKEEQHGGIIKKNISVKELGKYKRKCWEFQKEYRYKIIVAPWSIDELKNIQSKRAPEELMKLLDRVLKEDDARYCDEIFLELADDAFEGMEILLAPKTTEADYIIVNALLEKYCTGIDVKVEKSKIRIK